MNTRFRFTPVLVMAVAGSLLTASWAFAKPGEGEPRYAEAKGVVTVGGTAGMLPGPRAITDGSGDVLYVAQPTDDGTALARVRTGGAEVRSRFIGDGFTVPSVALDESTSGLSADGRTLVLAPPWLQLGQSSTSFRILDAKSLRLRDTIEVPGSYGFDAISPDGNLIYLIRYTSRTDPSEYEVRAYDVPSGHLLKRPVVDPDEAGEPMTGKPVTRAMSPDGRWAYTLYTGSEEGPFVHALDTSRRQAVCVDLVGLDLPKHLTGSELAVSAARDEVSVVRKGSELGSIDTATFAVSPPVSDAPATGSDGPPWPLIAAIAAGALALTAIASMTLRRRRRLASS